MLTFQWPRFHGNELYFKEKTCNTWLKRFVYKETSACPLNWSHIKPRYYYDDLKKCRLFHASDWLSYNKLKILQLSSYDFYNYEHICIYFDYMQVKYLESVNYFLNFPRTNAKYLFYFLMIPPFISGGYPEGTSLLYYFMGFIFSTWF